jgi:hypothetical protein
MIAVLPVTGEEFAKVAVVIALHFHVKNFRIGLGRVDDKGVSKKVDNVLADVVELIFKFSAVPLDQINVLTSLVFFLVLNSNNGSPGHTAGSD